MWSHLFLREIEAGRFWWSLRPMRCHCVSLSVWWWQLPGKHTKCSCWVEQQDQSLAWESSVGSRTLWQGGKSGKDLWLHSELWCELSVTSLLDTSICLNVLPWTKPMYCQQVRHSEAYIGLWELTVWTLGSKHQAEGLPTGSHRVSGCSHWA